MAQLGWQQPAHEHGVVAGVGKGRDAVGAARAERRVDGVVRGDAGEPTAGEPAVSITEHIGD